MREIFHRFIFVPAVCIISVSVICGFFFFGSTGTNDAPETDMVFVEGGTFLMGSDSGEVNEQPVHLVAVGDFYIGKNEVTQKEWVEVTGGNPSNFIGDSLPVEQVSWYDAVEFCNAKSLKEGLQQVYTINKTQQDSNNTYQYDDLKWTVTVNWNANGYRLPTEAEWEYAAKGGKKAKGYIYSGSNFIDSVSWYSYVVSGKESHPVGKKCPNELGIFDMSGNAWEWCWDWYGENYYAVSPSDDPKGPASGTFRVFRGGGWYGNESGSLPSRRNSDGADNSSYGLGFRLARSK